MRGITDLEARLLGMVGQRIESATLDEREAVSALASSRRMTLEQIGPDEWNANVTPAGLGALRIYNALRALEGA